MKASLGPRVAAHLPFANGRELGTGPGPIGVSGISRHTARVSVDGTGLPHTFTRTTPSARTAIVAHRGGWGAAAENTLAAFENAINLGVDMIEFDVRRTGDGRLVVHHDPDRA